MMVVYFTVVGGLFYKILLREGIEIKIIEGYITNKIIEGVLKKYFAINFHFVCIHKLIQIFASYP